MSRCRALLEVSQEFIEAICGASLDRPSSEFDSQPVTRKSKRPGHILVRCDRQEGECNDAWGHLVYLFDQPCKGEFHSYMEDE